MIRRICSGLAMAAVLVASLPVPAQAALGLALVKNGFTAPVFLTHAGDSRLFVVEQGGLIKIIHADLSVSTFLNVSAKISKGGERGLLGLAFHPDYATNGLFYVDYTRKGDGATVIAEYEVKAGFPNLADPASARVVIKIGQPYSNHNGGWIGFKGPYLYIAMGDGGSGGDPGNRAQKKTKLLGKILRINPLDPPGAASYSIPASNPFVGGSGRGEIWALGLRNPWRCSFDGEDLWCGDVGQEKWEEIDRFSAGGVNLGWRKLEGSHYYKWSGHTSGTVCTSDCRTLPIAEYSHGSVNCSITGGYVSRRSGAPLYGQYFFGDYCSGRVWQIPANFTAGGALPAPVDDTSHNISSFGEDNLGRIYLVDRKGGIYRLTGS
jgi:glucose/arabinose dehydrogenase